MGLYIKQKKNPYSYKYKLHPGLFLFRLIKWREESEEGASLLPCGRVTDIQRPVYSNMYISINKTHLTCFFAETPGSSVFYKQKKGGGSRELVCGITQMFKPLIRVNTFHLCCLCVCVCACACLMAGVWSL